MRGTRRVVASFGALAFFFAPVSQSINAQQSETAKKPAPKLSVDDVQIPRSPDGTSTSRIDGRSTASLPNAGGPVADEWVSYPLSETGGVSIELPGEPHTISGPLPKDVTEGSVLKSYFYRGHDVAVFITYGLSPNSTHAWNFVAGTLDGVMKNQGVTDSKVQGDYNAGAKRVPLRVVGKINGTETEFKGTLFFMNEREEVLMVLAQFPRANSKARAIATRAVDSVEITR